MKPISFGMFLTGAFFLSAPVHAEELAITNATVFDGTGVAPYSATVVIEDGKIASIDKTGAVPDGIETLDADGKALLPGFYDLHVHYTFYGEPATPPQISQAYLAAGVTSVFDFAQAPEAFGPQREWIESFPSPHVNFAARMSTTNGHGADWSDQTTTKWVNTPYAAKEAVDELVPYEPDVIKVFTDGWRYGSGIDNTSMDEPTLTALVEEAHAKGLPVLTHTVTVDRAGLAARAGVDVLAHSMLDEDVDQETIGELLEAGTSYAATLAVYQADKPGIADFEMDSKMWETRMERYKIGLRNIKALSDAGVNVALGTDAGMRLTPHGESTLREMEQMVRAGMTPTEALMAGTSNSAKAVGQIDERGAIEVGKAADLILIDGKPWDNISDIRNLEITWVDGDRLFGPGAPEPVEAEYMAASVPDTPLINAFETEEGRTSTGGLVTGDPDGGMERSWQVYEVVEDEGHGGVLRLNAKLGRREEARVGVILPMNVGRVQPMDVSAYDGLKLDLRGDGGEYTIAMTTPDGRWDWTTTAEEDWSTKTLAFADLTPPAEDVAWNGEQVFDARVLIIRPGGERAWFDLDNVTLYKSEADT
ncbi:amidohydrolase family protein [Henriciella aquimarina]|uniref:amidohydrolase family protein n=1 Tax=Henriciella aquimarina TaxID=545261 RepID=UPI00117B8324|nr:amidohydrolase family protein [Henriciella aquimarina]